MPAELPSELPLEAPSGLGTASAVAEAVEALYGGALPPEGVLHVTAGARGPAGSAGAAGLHALLINDKTPQSPWDAFCLHLARARADVIITTGAILRAEPALRYDLGGPAALPEGLAAYRRDALGKRTAPELWVLSHGAVDPAHPALHSWARPRFVAPEGGLRALLSRPAGLVSVEAGPSTNRALYDAPCLVDELCLTVYDGPLDPALLGGALLAEPALEGLFGPPRSERRAGDFRFLRYAR